MTENGPLFRLDESIRTQNEKIINEFQGNGREILERQYRIDTFEDLVEKLSKGEEIVLASQEQARDEISQEFEKQGLQVGDGEKSQDPDEKEALDSIPADMRGQAVEFARQHGLKVKEILIVDNPKQLSQSIDNRRNQISENGGPVILIKAQSRKSTGFR